MKAFVIEQLGSPPVGAVRDVPEPIGAHQWAQGRRLLIDVHATGISFPDVLQSRGDYQHAVPVPYVTGGEISGVVLEAPPGSRFEPGDRVASLTLWGGAAERSLGLENYTVRIPDSMSYPDGAALQLNYSTAWFGLYRVAVSEQDTVLIHGAAGGVGTATVELAVARGARVIAVVSSDAKEQTARAAGATEVIRSDGPWLDAVRTLTDGRGVSVVIDPVGGDRFTDSLRALDVGGRLAVVGFAAGTIPTVKVNRLLLRDLSVVGVALAPYLAKYPEIGLRLALDLERMAAEGEINPLVGHRFALADTAEALRTIDDRRATAKVVVTIR